jgi:hypothetical protein
MPHLFNGPWSRGADTVAAGATLEFNAAAVFTLLFLGIRPVVMVESFFMLPVFALTAFALTVVFVLAVVADATVSAVALDALNASPW